MKKYLYNKKMEFLIVAGYENEEIY